MPTKKALELAETAGVDLVEISPSSDPPVVKIIDWGKYQYHKLKEQKKSRSSELKQMRLGLKIGSNDLEIKVRKIKKFLENGDRVKIMVVFKGREMAHKEIGFELMDKVLSMLSDVAVATEQQPQMAGRNLSINIRRK
jgi:translation initiation factor IF-3